MNKTVMQYVIVRGSSILLEDFAATVQEFLDQDFQLQGPLVAQGPTAVIQVLTKTVNKTVSTKELK